jgi:hypothetical protein
MVKVIISIKGDDLPKGSLQRACEALGIDNVQHVEVQMNRKPRPEDLDAF